MGSPEFWHALPGRLASDDNVIYAGEIPSSMAVV